ncbi:MAG TPA: 4Fe-4S dicluster domain-containing protein [Kofleriaceae bacterium]|nr:4Fe-4S dicluster domain-containing protein [Kofleriaceae bacterium]
MNELDARGASPGRDAPMPMLPPEVQAGYAELRRLPLFDGVPNEALARAMAAGGIERRELRRDAIVSDAAARPATSILYLYRGQVAAGVFDAAELQARRAEQARWEAMSHEEREQQSLLPPPPLARLARKNVALFMEGDLFNAAAAVDGGGAPIAFFTAAPVALVAIAPAAMAELAVRYPFFEARARRALQVARDRLRAVSGVKQEMLDFFVRHGISVSGQMVRVRQLDRCIDCKQCEQACEERYGARRLTLGGYQLGMLDFVYTCRTCSDQRCVDPCEYDSITYDARKGEVVINEATCTGCTMCAQACPYDAIEMIDVEDPESPTYRHAFKLRLDGKDKLGFGPGTGRLARPRRIANKCDHCSAYGDQACVSACPTGSLIEVSAHDLFRERSPAGLAMARAGYDQELVLEHQELLPVEPFTEGMKVRDGGRAKIRRGLLGPVILWGVGLAAWCLALVEILLRTYAKGSSLQYAQFRKAGDLHEQAIERVSYHAGVDIAVWCGYAGAGLLAISALYPVWRRFRLFRWISSNAMWFDFHMMAGVVGPMFILLHSAFKLDNWVSVAFWCMVIVVISGVIGRYLYTQVPDLMNGRELEELDHQRAFARLRAVHPAPVAVAEQELAHHRSRAERFAAATGLIGAFFWILAEDLRRPFRRGARRGRFKAAGAPRHVVKELTRRTGRSMLINRRQVLAPRAQLVLHSWKMVHVPFTILLVIISALHIYVAFKFSM